MLEAMAQKDLSPLVVRCKGVWRGRGATWLSSLSTSPLNKGARDMWMLTIKGGKIRNDMELESIRSSVRGTRVLNRWEILQTPIGACTWAWTNIIGTPPCVVMEWVGREEGYWEKYPLYLATFKTVSKSNQHQNGSSNNEVAVSDVSWLPLHHSLNDLGLVNIGKLNKDKENGAKLLI